MPILSRKPVEGHPVLRSFESLVLMLHLTLLLMQDDPTAKSRIVYAGSLLSSGSVTDLTKWILGTSVSTNTMPFRRTNQSPQKHTFKYYRILSWHGLSLLSKLKHHHCPSSLPFVCTQGRPGNHRAEQLLSSCHCLARPGEPYVAARKHDHRAVARALQESSAVRGAFLAVEFLHMICSCMHKPFCRRKAGLLPGRGERKKPMQKPFAEALTWHCLCCAESKESAAGESWEWSAAKDRGHGVPKHLQCHAEAARSPAWHRQPCTHGLAALLHRFPDPRGHCSLPYPYSVRIYSTVVVMPICNVPVIIGRSQDT